MFGVTKGEKQRKSRFRWIEPRDAKNPSANLGRSKIQSRN